MENPLDSLQTRKRSSRSDLQRLYYETAEYEDIDRRIEMAGNSQEENKRQKTQRSERQKIYPELWEFYSQIYQQ